MKKILFVASEAVPFIKTGGLADVVGSLPKYFNQETYDVRIIIPKYLCIKSELREQLTYLTHFYMPYNGKDRYVGILSTVVGGITYYFVDNEEYFAGDRPYMGGTWDLEKFCFFSRAVLSALPLIPYQPDIVHCHDWQSALIPVLLKDSFKGNAFFWDMKSVMTIHNLKFQGVWDIPTIQHLTGLSDYYFTSDKLEAYNNGNLLKGGLAYADKITTVSHTYAQEIKTDYFGEGLNGLISARGENLAGILNGIDYEDFNPQTDPCIDYHYSVEDFRTQKKKNKKKLQQQLHLEQDEKKFMIGIVSRMTDQKGFDLIACVLQQLCADDVQLVILGTGEKRYEDMFVNCANQHSGQVSANLCYSEELSHKIYAACDAFLMPSLFEPCGLSQLMSLRYGTIPIVRETGGLKDTVEPYNKYEGTGTGFSFANYNAHEMLYMVEEAKKLYFEQKREWNKLVERAMQKDYSWNSSAREYEKLYEGLF
jgi:starch synthase